MKRYMRAFRGHRLLVVTPMVLALVAGLFFELRQPQPYLAQGTIWADAPVPDGSTVFSLSQPNPSAATQEASVLSELLSTDQFLTQVGHISPWATYLRDHPQAFPDWATSVRKGAAVAVVGPQVISVGFKANNSQTAGSLTRAIMTAFITQVVALQRTRDNQQIGYDNQSLKTAASALDSAQSQLSTYLLAHPQRTGSTTDPTVTQLSGNVATAEQLYGSAVSNYNGAELQLSQVADSSQLHVIDEPGVPALQGRKKKIVYAAVGGLLAGAVISVLLLSWLVARDTSAGDAEDVEEGLGLNVVASIDEVESGRRRGRRVS